MRLRRIFRIGCLVAATASLAVGYAGIGLWVWVGVVLVASLAWVVGHRRIFGGLNSTGLVIWVGLAGGGLLAGAAPFWMILGATLTLGGWDLTLLDRTLAGALPGLASDRLERNHLSSLGLALVPGLLVAIIGPLIRFQISLGAMALLVVLGLIGLDRVWRALGKN